MSRENIVISLDGHPECFVNFKPWMPSRYHAAFDDAVRESYRTWSDSTRYFADMMAAGGELVWEVTNDLHTIDTQRYHEVLTGEQRIARIDADGVAAEMLIDGFGPATTDVDLQHQVAEGFCRWFKDYTAAAPYRFTGALVVSLAAGQDVVVREIEMAWEHGIRAIHLPAAPQLTDPALPHYNHPVYEPMWQAMNERGMAAVWHPSFGREVPLWRWAGTEPGWEAILMNDFETVIHTTLRYLLLSGVPERHPNLKIVYVESGSQWIPPILKQLDRFFHAPTTNPKHKLQMKPSEQWARQGYAAGPLDSKEIEHRREIGVSNLVFGTDDIHTEATWPNTRKHLSKLLGGLPKEERWAIVAGNAQRILGFDLDKLAQTKAAQIPWDEPAVAL